MSKHSTRDLKTPARPSRRKQVLFRVVVVLAPMALLVLAEWASRLFGFGGYSPVIQRVGDEGACTWYATNRAGTDSFFYSRRSRTGGMRELHFRSPKPPDTVRIALVGESAIQGYPQTLPLTNGSFIEAMLRDVWGDTPRVEVLNFGATAVASFPVLCFLEEILDHDPDVVVVMCGNNEFYGAYGVASLHGAGRSPTGMRAMRWFRGLGLAQWLESFGRRDPPPAGQLMEQVAVEQQIGPQDPLRRAAAGTLRSHLTEMVRLCVARRVPIVLCTVPTNERGLAPIGLATEESESSAAAHFRRGSEFTQLGHHEEALTEYVKARDLDTMPWRATSEMDRAIREAAREGAILCDVQAAFRSASPGGAIGWELMDDHVHMSVAGQALFARTLLSALTSMPGRLRASPERLVHLSSWETYAQRLGRSIYTDYVAAGRMKSLFAISFMKRSNEPARLRFETLCQELLAQMSEGDRRAVERWRDPDLHGATERPLTSVVGIYRMLDGDYATAAGLFESARADVPAGSLWRLESTWFLLKCHRHLRDRPTPEDFGLCSEAIELGELLRRFGGEGKPEVLRYLGMAYHLAGDHLRAIACLEEAVRGVKGADGWEVVQTLADAYLQLGQVASARRLLEMATQDPGMTPTARQMLESIDVRTKPTPTSR